MKIIKDISSLQENLKLYKDRMYTVGFIPTMGSLHKGHLSLIEQSIQENNRTICSIYINPTQFNNNSDLQKYPKNHIEDLDILQKTGCDVVFLPSNHEMYGNAMRRDNYKIGGVLSVLEGEKRPGHFSGVLTIVNKLFKLIQPNIAYFGEKDFQQLWIIRQNTINQEMAIEIKSCKTIRNAYGLALSSRNQHLSITEELAARNIFKSLTFFKKSISSYFLDEKKSTLDEIIYEKIKTESLLFINQNRLIKLDYFDVIEIENFSFVKNLTKEKNYRVLVAVYVGNTRLIDNILI